MKRVTDTEARELIAKTQQIEVDKASRQAERDRKRKEKDEKVKRGFQEKLVAPVLLLLTLLISLLLVFLY